MGAVTLRTDERRKVLGALGSERKEALRALRLSDQGLINIVEDLVGAYLRKIGYRHNEALPQPREVARALQRIARAIKDPLDQLSALDSDATRLAIGMLHDAWERSTANVKGSAGERLPALDTLLVCISLLIELARKEAQRVRGLPSLRGRPRLHADGYLTEHAITIWKMCGRQVGQSRPGPLSRSSDGGPLERFLTTLGEIARSRDDSVQYNATSSLRSYIRGHPARAKGRPGRPKK